MYLCCVCAFVCVCFHNKKVVYAVSRYRLGGENLAVAQNAYAVTWFKEKEINMVFGLLLSVARLVGKLIIAT